MTPAAVEALRRRVIEAMSRARRTGFDHGLRLAAEVAVDDLIEIETLLAWVVAEREKKEG